MGITIQYLGATQAAPGEMVDPPCNVVLTTPLPNWPVGVEGSAVSVGLGWAGYQYKGDLVLEFESITILHLTNHPNELLRPGARQMPQSGPATWRLAIFRPSTDEEYEQGYNWIQTDIVLDIVIENSSDTTECPEGYHYDQESGLCIPDEETCPDGYHWDEDTQTCVKDSSKKWIIGALAGLGAALTAGGLWILRKK